MVFVQKLIKKVVFSKSQKISGVFSFCVIMRLITQPKNCNSVQSGNGQYHSRRIGLAQALAQLRAIERFESTTWFKGYDQAQPWYFGPEIGEHPLHSPEWQWGLR